VAPRIVRGRFAGRHEPAPSARGATEGRSHHHDQGFGAKSAENRRKRAEPPIMKREPGRGRADWHEEHASATGEAVVYCSR
jgi:hypothetical protein